MNKAKLWLVVKATVGVALFRSAVAVGSFAVHLAVLSNTAEAAYVSPAADGERGVTSVQATCKALEIHASEKTTK